MRKYLIRMMAGPALVLMVMLGLSLSSIHILTRLTETTLHSREIENVAQDVLLQAINMETGLRGYIASHDSRFLEPYSQANAKINELFTRLESLTQGKDEQAESVRALRPTFTEWLNFAEGAKKEVAGSHQLLAPPASFLNLTGKALMDGFRHNIDSLIRSERQLYSKNRARAKLSVDFSMYSIAGLAVLLGLFAIFHIRKEVTRLAGEFAQNIEETKRSKEALEILNLSLENTVKERTANLEAINSELEAFCYSVSHDLRAPLRGIDGFSTALFEDFGAELPESGKNYIRFIRQGIQRMGQLIDDLLTLSKLTRMEPTIEEIDLGEMSKEVEKEVESLHPKHRVTFKGLDHATIHGDRSLIHAALTNLISNAWKFTQNVENPTIEFGMQVENEKRIFFVKDNGVGFDMAYYPKLFGAFQRLHSAKDFPGTGVGLATVRRIMRRHGGDVWAEAAPGQGATFYFTLNS